MSFFKQTNICLPAAVGRAIAQLGAAGHEAYPVGGCVRDTLLGKTPSDWDVATDAEPARVAEAFSGFRVIETGLKHGTVTVLIDKMPIEITTYRVDGLYTDHRRPDAVTFTRSLTEDLARRDFTVNAMACRPGEGVIDPFGGADDLEKGILRCVGEADRRFGEDPLRILRGMRFMATYGFTAEAETDASMRRNRELLRFISAERVRVELEKLLLGKYARRVLAAYTDILTFVIPELAPCVGYPQHNLWHDLDIWAHTLKTVENVPAEPALRWAALLHDIGKPASVSTGEDGSRHFYGHADIGADMAAKIMARLKFDNATRDAVKNLIESHMDYPEPTGRSVNRAILRCGAAHFGEILLLQRADMLALWEDAFAPRTEVWPLTDAMRAKRRASLEKDEAIIALYEQMKAKPHCFSLDELAIDGQTVMALGYGGKDIGRAKETLLWAVADGKVKNEKEALTAYLKRNGIRQNRRKK